MPTRWMPRTTQIDADAFSHPSQENPLKILLGSGLLVTPGSRTPEIHQNAYGVLTLLDHNRRPIKYWLGVTTPPSSPERVSSI